MLMSLRAPTFYVHSDILHLFLDVAQECSGVVSINSSYHADA